MQTSFQRLLDNIIKGCEMKKMCLLFLLFFLYPCSLSFAQLADSPWPMYGQNLQHTGRGTSLYSASSTVKWRYQTGGNSVESSPAIGSDGTVYVGSTGLDNKYLYAVNSDGTLKWFYQTGNSVYSSPAIGSDGTVYVGSRDRYLYAIHSDGTLKWKYQTGGHVDSSPAIGSDGTVYVGSNGPWDNNYLYAVKPDGTLKWKYQTGVNVVSSPAIGSDGTVYVGSDDQYLYAVNYDGTLKWKYQTGDDVDSSPAIGSDGTVYVGSRDNSLYAVNSDGTLKWKYQIGSDVGSPAIGSDGTVYVGSQDNSLYAVDSDGTLKWKYQTGNLVCSSPAIGSDGTVYVGSDDQYIYAIKSDGALKWKYRTGSLNRSSPALDIDGTVYVGTHLYLYAFAPVLYSVTLSSPNGGEELAAGSIKKIEWTSSGIANVKIEFSTNGGISWTTIAENAQSIGYYEWTVPTNIISTNCLIKISDSLNANTFDISQTSFSIVLPIITVTYPNGAEKLAAGRNINITWASTSANNVNLQLSSNNGITWTSIAQNIQSTGSYSWGIPDISSQYCLIKVSDNTISSVSDISNSVFNIDHPLLTIAYPNGGERLAVGRYISITWTSTYSCNVKIEYSKDSGNSWIPITMSTSGYATGYSWTVPNDISSNCLIKISDTQDNNIYDISNSSFSMAQSSLTLTYPNGGETFMAGETEVITWISTTDNIVKIEYTNDEGITWTTINSNAPANGSYNWAIPNVFSALCWVKISDAFNTSIFDISNASFSIVQPQVTLTAPNGGQSLVAGSTTSITWTSTAITNVKLEYSSNNGSSWPVIAASTNAAADTYTWTIPAVTSSQCLVRVSDASNATVNDVSDAVFTILQPQVTLTAPNGGELWIIGSQCTITWESSNLDSVRVKYSTNNGSTWMTITESTVASAESYEWTVPNSPSVQCLVRISDSANASVNDVSNAVFTIEGQIGVEENTTPTSFSLSKNYPNPFNPTTTIEYSIPESGMVSLVIYNTAGQKVSTLIDQEQEAGQFKAIWDGRDDNGMAAASGIYFYRLSADKFSKIEKMVLMK